MDRGADFEVRADLSAPREARRSLTSLDVLIPKPCLEDAKLLVSELVTNSVKHAGLSAEESIRVRVRVEPPVTRIEVSQPVQGQPILGTPSEEPESGWGLFLVDCLADRWGVEHDHDTVVWFEIRAA